MGITRDDLSSLQNKGNEILREVDAFDKLLGRLRLAARGEDDFETPELLQYLEDLALLSQKISSMFGELSLSTLLVWKEKNDPIALLTKLLKEEPRKG